MALVIYGPNGEQVEVATVEDMNAELHRLDRFFREEGRRDLIEIENPDTKRFLSIGLGDDCSIASWIDAGAEPPEDLYSIGEDADTDDDEVVEWLVSGETTEFLGWVEVPVTSTRAAAEQFFRTGERPTTVKWHETW